MYGIYYNTNCLEALFRDPEHDSRAIINGSKQWQVEIPLESILTSLKLNGMPPTAMSVSTVQAPLQVADFLNKENSLKKETHLTA